MNIKKRENEIGGGQSVKGGMLQRSIHIPPRTGVIHKNHACNGDASQNVKSEQSFGGICCHVCQINKLVNSDKDNILLAIKKQICEKYFYIVNILISLKTCLFRFYCYFCPQRISIPPLFKNLAQIYYEKKESASIFRWAINVWVPNERSNQ